MAQRDPEAIKADIDRARDELAATVDSLTERAHPQRIVADIKQAVVGFIKRPPVALALAGAGTLTVVLVIRRIRNR